MRVIGASLLLATVAFAGLVHAQPRVAPPPPPPNRKPALPTFSPQQLSSWANAMLAEKRGDLDEAEREWDNVVRGEPVANGFWNLADCAIRHERYRDAIRALENYVKHPDADVAEGEALLAKLKTMPYRLSISGDEPRGTIFIDGVKFSAPAPVTIELDPGDHAIHWIGKQGYDDAVVYAKPGSEDVKKMGTRDGDPKGGNVAIGVYGQIGLSREWEYKGNTFTVDRRFTLPPGRYDIPFYEPNRACSNLVFDVPRDGFVFVFVKAERKGGPGGCAHITVTTTKVKL